MVSLKDVENNTLPMGSYRFDYLLAACKAEQQTLLQEKDDVDDDDFDHYHLHDGITNVVEHPSTCKSDEPKPDLKTTIVEEEKEGICLTKPRRPGKVTTKPRSHTRESGVSSSSNGGEAALELNTSPNGKRKRSRNEGAAEMTNSNKQKHGGSGGNNSQEPPPPGLPAEIKNLLLYLPENRVVSAGKLVIEKQLTETDVNHHHNRLSIPMKHTQETFLTEEEELLLCVRRNEKNVGSIDGVPLITPMMEVASVSLRRWEMKKTKGPSSITYVLTSTWNTIREQNGLESGMIVQLWAIRIDGHLCFALTTLP